MTDGAKKPKTPEKDAVKKKKPSFFIRFAVTLLLMLGVFVVAAVITYIATYFSPVKTIATYEDCVSSKGSVVQETYPSVCVTHDGKRFVQQLSEEEQKLLDSPLNQNSGGSYEGQFCGGIAGVACPQGYTCKLDGSYPDAGGKCTKN